MQTNCEYLSYQQTGYFSKLVTDYLQAHKNLSQFYTHPVSIEGIKQAIEARKKTSHHRQLLVDVLTEQYRGINLTAVQNKHLLQLLLPNTFTITTAHQPNIFTGHLYFIYKILHTIQLAKNLAEQLPGNNFVPVFYMGSEDADLDELGHVVVDAVTHTWHTNQTGAVGRMMVDKDLLKIIDAIRGTIGVFEFGNELADLFAAAYQPGTTIQQATLTLINALFNKFGLLVLIPDNAQLKKPFNDIVKKELSTQFSHPLVEATSLQLAKHYKPQATGREINLFYLLNDHRERIEREGDQFLVKSLELSFSELEILNEVDVHPERFSANVILRGVFQEMILPNIAFIGGGGELAYWLELKQVFEASKVPFPMLVLRNSFLLVDVKQQSKIEQLGFTSANMFKGEEELFNSLVRRESEANLVLTAEKAHVEQLYHQIQQIAANIDVTLTAHIEALSARAAKTLVEVEKKMLRAEKRKYEAKKRQLAAIYHELFPDNNLQERVENMAMWYARYGESWIQLLISHSQPLQQKFGILYLP